MPPRKSADDIAFAAFVIVASVPLFWIAVTVISVLLAMQLIRIPSDADQYWYATVGAFIGAVLGAIWTYVVYLIGQLARRASARTGLLESLKFSRQLTNQAIGQMLMLDPPNYPLDVAALIRWIDRAGDALPSEVIKSVDGLRYQIEHANQKLAMLYSIAATFGKAAATQHPEYCPTRGHLQQIVSWTDDRIAEVENA